MVWLRCRSILRMLEETVTRHGWFGGVYSFTLAQQWMDENTCHVQEATTSLTSYLNAYHALGISQSVVRQKLVSSDVPQFFCIRDFPAMFGSSEPVTRFMAVQQEYGMESILLAPSYGYGGALGLTALFSRTAHVAPQIIADSTADLALVNLRMATQARDVIRGQLGSVALTDRENECMLWVANGYKSREIARLTHISTRTVDFHIGNAISKLGASSRSEAAAKFIQLSGMSTGGSLTKRPIFSRRAGASPDRSRSDSAHRPAAGAHRPR